MTESSRTYLPAAGHDWFLPFYDPIVKLMGGEVARQELLEQANLPQAGRVLEVGCGTGTLATLIKRLHPDTDVVGIDPDPRALARARRKAARAGLSIRFDLGFGDELPYPDASFDRVFFSFVFHHLTSEEKTGTLRAIRRVLKPGGSLHLVDFEGPEGGKDGFVARLLHSSERLHDNSEPRLLSFIRQAGFRDAAKVGRRSLLLGHVAYFRAVA